MKPRTINTSIADALAKVQRVRGALEARDISISSGSSLGSIFAKMDRLNKQHTKNSGRDDQSTFRVAMEALRIAEALDVAVGVPGSEEAIHRIVTSDMSMSGRQDSRGKDMLWELDLYRRLRLGGAAVRFAEPDLVIDLGGSLGEISVACKKVNSESGVANSVGIGCEQLVRHGRPGVIAFNIDDTLEEKEVWDAPTEAELKQRLDSRLMAFVNEHKAALDKAIGCPQCDGIFISIAVLSMLPIVQDPTGWPEPQCYARMHLSRRRRKSAWTHFWIGLIE